MMLTANVKNTHGAPDGQTPLPALRAVAGTRCALDITNPHWIQELNEQC